MRQTTTPTNYSQQKVPQQYAPNKYNGTRKAS